ncbi:hypothetical protein [Salinicoccus albus]|uniref:hypothetical protein n=1 Tax=Salinicoccus albus TaxID=418756 RepID=UPI00037139EA|nr:hypothetical protein [Salinicoccus albus]
MAKRSKLKDPGLLMVLILAVYSAFVFAWWPMEIYLAGISLVAWLMFFGLFIWFTLTVIYTVWIERIEKNESD